MTRDEYLHVLATEPLTATQRGAVLGEFRRLGLDSPADRSRRLAVSAAILGLDELTSTADLSMGQAGQLVSALRSITDCSGLPDPRRNAARHVSAATEAPGTEPGRAGMSLAEALARLVMILAAASMSRKFPCQEPAPESSSD